MSVAENIPDEQVTEALELIRAELEAAPVEATASEDEQLAVLEAILFAAAEPLDEATMALHMARGPAGEGADIPALLAKLREYYSARGVHLVEAAGRWSLRTAAKFADYLKVEKVRPVKISRAAAETLAVIAYHQPVTRAEVEAVRGVATSKDILEYLMQTGWIRPGAHRETPGRPLTWLTTPAFLDHFGLSGLQDLPGMEELKAAGLLNAAAPITYGVVKSDDAPTTLRADDGDDDFADLKPSAETTAETAGDEAEAEEADDDIVDEEDDDDFDDEDSEDEESAEAAEDDAEESDDEIVDEDDDDDFDDEDDEDDDELAEDESDEVEGAAEENVAATKDEDELTPA